MATQLKLICLIAVLLIAGILTYVGHYKGSTQMPNRNVQAFVSQDDLNVFVGTTTFTVAWWNDTHDRGDSIRYSLNLDENGTGLLSGDGYQTCVREKIYAVPAHAASGVVSIDIIYDKAVVDSECGDFSSTRWSSEERMFGINYAEGVYTFRKISDSLELEDGTRGTR